MKPKLSKSPWVVHFNCNSCNGCDIEFLACLMPHYDLERFGILHVGNPKHADVLVVTGSVNHRNARVLRNVYEQMPNPKVVVALGVCTSSGGIFAEAYNILGGVEKIVPVDVFVPGCPPRPEAMIDGIVKAAYILEAKRRGQPAVAALKPTHTEVPNLPAAEPAKPAAEPAKHTAEPAKPAAAAGPDQSPAATAGQPASKSSAEGQPVAAAIAAPAAATPAEARPAAAPKSAVTSQTEGSR